MLSEPKKYSYPAGYESTLDEVKSNISELSNDEGSLFVDEFPCNYVTVSDVFVSDKGKQMENYVAPTESDVFMHRIFIRSDRVVATYTRVINGFTTEELITLNSPVAEKGSVTRQGAEYTSEDLSSVPDIGEAIEKLKLSGLKPSHIEIKDGMSFKYSIAQGFYRKVDGKVYGVVRVLWYYTHPNQKEYYIRDDRYYLYDEIGNGAIVEREELRALIGDDQIIKSFPYDFTLGLA